LEERAYQWIREHTTLADRFFPYDKNGTKFIRETGRFLPGEINLTTKETHHGQKAAYRAILDSCDASGFREMQIAYVYVSPDFPADAENFEMQCLVRKLGAELVYHDEQAGDFRRMYRLPLPR
ncbi:MAG: hypothetical protein Q8R35_02540, partial [bacterium]|nr:hypothetical protein [bacterium]